MKRFLWDLWLIVSIMLVTTATLGFISVPVCMRDVHSLAGCKVVPAIGITVLNGEGTWMQVILFTILMFGLPVILTEIFRLRQLLRERGN